MKKDLFRRGMSLLLSLCVMLGCASCGAQTAAATMRLKKTEGTVSVADGESRAVTLKENLGLYSGYQVETRAESYAWVNLDDVKLTKMDENSGITIQKEGKHLEILVNSGGLFFNVTEPLADDESLNIRTSTMAVGIRGTCGWVTTDAVYLLEGTVEVSAGEETATVNAGEMAYLTPDGKLVVEKFYEPAVPVFVQEEVEGDEDIPEVPDESQAQPTKSYQYYADGTLYAYYEYTYNEQGLQIQVDSYFLEDGAFSLVSHTEILYDDQGEEQGVRIYNSSGMLTEYQVQIERTADHIVYASYNENGEELYQYTINLNQEGQTTSAVFDDGGSSICEYDQAGRLIRDIDYQADGTVSSYVEFVYD